MGNVIPWSQIHPSIKTEEPFVAVVIVDPQREICVSEMVEFELEALANPDTAAPELIAAAQAAIKKLGARYEGTLRNQRIRPDGSYRDTVIFSITESEWPAVKARLEERLRA